jgi:hypothetical protein
MKLENAGLTPARDTKSFCRGDGIGIHACLRNKILRVQIPPPVPVQWRLTQLVRVPTLPVGCRVFESHIANHGKVAEMKMAQSP